MRGERGTAERYPGRVWGYIRVSSPGQDREGTSPEGQRDAITRFCTREGLPSPTHVHEVESATEGHHESREEQLRIQREARPGDLILVTVQDRWSRDVVHAVGTVRKLVAAGIGWIAIAEGIDASTPQGDWMLVQRAAWAEQEARRIRERTHGRIRELRDEGKYVEGAAWVGYVVQDRRLVPGPLRALPVEAFERCARGESMARIAAALPLTPDRRAWDRGAVHKMLNSRAYLGESRRSDGTWHATHEPLVSRELWERAHAAMRERRRGGRPPGAGESSACLLRGLAVCSRCGRRVGVQYGPRREGARTMRYLCNGSVGAPRRCSARHVHAGKLDALVAEAALDRLVELRHLLAQAGPTPPPKPPAVDHAAQLAAVKRKRARLLDAYEDGAIKKAELKERLAKLDAETGRLELAAAEDARRREAEERASRPEVRADALARVEAIRAAWSRAPVADRREVLALLAARIEVVPAARKFSHEVVPARITWRTVEDLLAEV